MAYFEDLTVYTYLGIDESYDYLNIGWLSCEHDFPTGQVCSRVIEKLERLAEKPVSLCRGVHYCEYCPPPVFEKGDQDFVSRVLIDCPNGNGEIHVEGKNGITYVAPALLVHYITEHRYLPPREFLMALDKLKDTQPK